MMLQLVSINHLNTDMLAKVILKGINLYHKHNLIKTLIHITKLYTNSNISSQNNIDNIITIKLFLIEIQKLNLVAVGYS